MGVVPLNAAGASHHNSIPRLELVAAVRAVKMRNKVENDLGTKFPKVYLWTDSEVVIKQLRDYTTHFPAFVANRLSQIHAGSTDEEWRYVDTSQNPADLCSRGILAHETEKWAFYHQGPKFLRLPQSEWPKTNIPCRKKEKNAQINAIETQEATHLDPPPPTLPPPTLPTL